jgi:hypothetical protein
MLVHARELPPAPPPGPVVEQAATNSVAPVVPAAPSVRVTSPAPAPNGPPFMELLADMADAIRLPVWLLYFLLVLMVGVLTTMLLRRRPH